MSGLCADRLEIVDVRVAIEIANRGNLAKYLHLLCLIPLDYDMPSLPIGALFHDGSDNTFNSKVIQKHW